MMTSARLSKNVTLTLFASILAISLIGCVTVTPDKVRSGRPSYDSSTPSQYDPYNSGLLGFIEEKDSKGKVYTSGAVVTQGAKTRYNKLIAVYRLQFDSRYHVLLNADDGLKEYKDLFGNSLVFIDSEHLQYFARLQSMASNRVAEDGLWLKATSVLK